ncbi:UNVERIFIED_CONTAM: hypothetical protein K2H54_058348 [Gekko kuhli]
MRGCTPPGRPSGSSWWGGEDSLRASEGQGTQQPALPDTLEVGGRWDGDVRHAGDREARHHPALPASPDGRKMGQCAGGEAASHPALPVAVEGGGKEGPPMSGTAGKDMAHTTQRSQRPPSGLRQQRRTLVGTDGGRVSGSARREEAAASSSSGLSMREMEE